MKNKNILTLERHLKSGEGFIKLMKPSKVTEYLKEAKRVKYIVKKDDMSFFVNDDETGELVFNGIKMNRSLYACTFSKKYWEEPPIVVSASELEEKRITLDQLEQACNS